MIKALLFDMDGVLVDVSRSYRRAIEETASHFTGRDIEAGTTQRYKNLGGFNDDWRLTHAIISDTGIQVPFSRVVDDHKIKMDAMRLKLRKIRKYAIDKEAWYHYVVGSIVTLVAILIAFVVAFKCFT
jgi:beta-phosphoglucomutase-like phosphatase (HAD superfamily)